MEGMAWQSVVCIMGLKQGSKHDLDIASHRVFPTWHPGVTSNTRKGQLNSMKYSKFLDHVFD